MKCTPPHVLTRTTIFSPDSPDGLQDSWALSSRATLSVPFRSPPCAARPSSRTPRPPPREESRREGRGKPPLLPTPGPESRPGLPGRSDAGTSGDGPSVNPGSLYSRETDWLNKKAKLGRGEKLSLGRRPGLFAKDFGVAPGATPTLPHPTPRAGAATRGRGGRGEGWGSGGRRRAGGSGHSGGGGGRRRGLGHGCPRSVGRPQRVPTTSPNQVVRS